MHTIFPSAESFPESNWSTPDFDCRLCPDYDCRFQADNGFFRLDITLKGRACKKSFLQAQMTEDRRRMTVKSKSCSYCFKDCSQLFDFLQLHHGIRISERLSEKNRHVRCRPPSIGHKD